MQSNLGSHQVGDNAAETARIRPGLRQERHGRCLHTSVMTRRTEFRDRVGDERPFP